MMEDKPAYSVYVNIYDFAPFNGCIAWMGLGFYHTGVEVNQMEFCYSVLDSNKETSGVVMIEPESAPHNFNRKLYIGQANMTLTELQELVDQLSKKYTCGEYDLFQNNCNHFSNELCLTLCGVPIPKDIFRLTGCMRYFCCWLPKGVLSGQWALKYYRRKRNGSKRNANNSHN